MVIELLSSITIHAEISFDVFKQKLLAYPTEENCFCGRWVSSKKGLNSKTAVNRGQVLLNYQGLPVGIVCDYCLKSYDINVCHYCRVQFNLYVRSIRSDTMEDHGVLHDDHGSKQI